MTKPAFEGARFQLSETEVIAANKAHFRARLLRADQRLMKRTSILLILVLFLLSASLAFLGKPSLLIATVSGLATFPLLSVAAYRWLAPLTARRAFRSDPSFQREMEFSWDADGFRLQTEKGTTDHLWSEVTAARKTHGALLLYRSPRQFQIIALRALADGEADAVIAAAVGNRGIST